MLYFDNAASTMHKPEQVISAVSNAMSCFGGPGRGSHQAALDASMAVFSARSRVANLLGVSSPKCVSFELNATMALNIAIEGLLPDRSKAVTTAASHNSVLRPLFRARDTRSCSVSVAAINPDGSLDWDSYERALTDASLVVVTHASNVTGDVYDVARMCEAAHESGALFILDAAQTAGCLPFSMQEIDADVVCFTGHKSLYGPQGTGGLAVREGLEIVPLLEGGSGVHSFDERHPRFMPEGLEAGTANAHGLAGLSAGVAFLDGIGVSTVQAKVQLLCDRFVDGISDVEAVRVYGGGEQKRCGIVALNIAEVDSGTVSDLLSSRYDICTRPGAHCAPLMHKALGTAEQGVVRFSFGWFNTEDEVDQAIVAIKEIAAELV